jgi:hypothetical protein
MLGPTGTHLHTHSSMPLYGMPMPKAHAMMTNKLESTFTSPSHNNIYTPLFTVSVPVPPNHHHLTLPSSAPISSRLHPRFRPGPGQARPGGKAWHGMPCSSHRSSTVVQAMNPAPLVTTTTTTTIPTARSTLAFLLALAARRYAQLGVPSTEREQTKAKATEQQQVRVRVRARVRVRVREQLNVVSSPVQFTSR